jgi:hypothetical protein
MKISVTSPKRDGEMTNLKTIATKVVTSATEEDATTGVVNQVLVAAVGMTGAKRSVEMTVTVGDGVKIDLQVRVRVGVTESEKRETEAVSRTIGERTIEETTEIVTDPDVTSTTGREIATNVLEIASSIVHLVTASLIAHVTVTSIAHVIVTSIANLIVRETANSTAHEIATSIARETREIEDGDVTKTRVHVIDRRSATPTTDRRATRSIDVIGTLTIVRVTSLIGETTVVVSRAGTGGQMTGVKLKMTGAGEVSTAIVFR